MVNRVKKIVNKEDIVQGCLLQVEASIMGLKRKCMAYQLRFTGVNNGVEK